MAQGLAEQKIGSLRFDSRASGRGVDLWKLQLSEHVEDIVAACQFASQIPGVSSVILIGHNQVRNAVRGRGVGITSIAATHSTAGTGAGAH